LLLRKNYHSVFRKRLFDRLNIGGIERTRQIDIPDLGGKVRRNRTDGDGHVPSGRK